MLVDATLFARLLWWYGEHERWARALRLDAAEAEGLSDECGRLYRDRAEVERAWPGAPWEAYLVLPVLWHMRHGHTVPARSLCRTGEAMPGALR